MIIIEKCGMHKNKIIYNQHLIYSKGGFLYMKNKRKFKILKKSKLNQKKEVEMSVVNIHKTKYISPRDACTCTGNCNGGVAPSWN